MCALAKGQNTCNEDPVVHLKSSVHYGNTKITHRALNVSVFKVLKLDTIWNEK